MTRFLQVDEGLSNGAQILRKLLPYQTLPTIRQLVTRKRFRGTFHMAVDESALKDRANFLCPLSLHHINGGFGDEEMK